MTDRIAELEALLAAYKSTVHDVNKDRWAKRYDSLADAMVDNAEALFACARLLRDAIGTDEIGSDMSHDFWAECNSALAKVGA
jgi:hypothetical protein